MKRFASSVMNFLIQSTKVTAVTFLTLNYVGGFVVCYGPSMEPTLRTRDVLLTEHISPRLGRIDIGDVVVARSPDDNRSVCKRVVAGPGDIVLFKNTTITIPDEFVWLEGDNKENSNDSRYYGPVPYSMIRRRCFCKVWPQLDANLNASDKYYLQSAPTTHQRARHSENEKQYQLLHQQSKDLLGTNDGIKARDRNSLLDVINDSKDEIFPLSKAGDNYHALQDLHYKIITKQ